MRDILQDIIAHKRIEIENDKKAQPLSALLSGSDNYMNRNTYSMRAALQRSSSGIIAEFKRKSPSKGWIHSDVGIAEIIPTYESAGASACSVLTDESYFGGTLDDLKEAREAVEIPLLRKDFIIDTYQLYQAKAAGADAVLLIAACLTKTQCRELALKAHELQLEVLLEIHREEEIEYLTSGIEMLGINNRNLGTFHTDICNSFRLAQQVRSYVSEKMEFSTPLLVAESGISDPGTVQDLRSVGFRGFLIGENFMKTECPGNALKQFIAALT